MTEEEKIAFYTNYTPILVAVDCIIFGFAQDRLHLLLFKRKENPFKGQWSVIGSFVRKEEGVTKAAERVLEESTGLQNIFMESLDCYGEVARDPGARVISQAYFALIRVEQTKEQQLFKEQAHWFDWQNIPPLILDHERMVQDALAKLRRKARYQPIGFELLPEKFTLPQLQSLYEAIYQKKLDRRNFRKRILSLGVLEKLNEKDKSASRKGAYLYRFDQEKYKNMLKQGDNFIL